MTAQIIPFMKPEERKELSERELQELQEALILQGMQVQGWWYNPKYQG